MGWERIVETNWKGFVCGREEVKRTYRYNTTQILGVGKNEIESLTARDKRSSSDI